MKGAWRVACVAEVDFYVHWSFSLIIPWLVWQGTVGGQEIEALIFIFVALLLLFLCVALHELGHAFAALRLNIVVKRVILLPIGGLAQIQAVPHRPLHEFLIAAAGPLVNLLIAAGLALILAIADMQLVAGYLMTPFTLVEAIFLQAPFRQSPLIGFTIFLIFANSILFIFNLIPMFPMDGGRMLRALLAMFLPYPRATQVAIGLGQFSAIAMLWLAFYLRSFGLLFIAICVFVVSLPFFMKRTHHPATSRLKLDE